MLCNLMRWEDVMNLLVPLLLGEEFRKTYQWHVVPAVSFVSGGSFPAALEAAELFLPKGAVAAQAAGSFLFSAVTVNITQHHMPFLMFLHMM